MRIEELVASFVRLVEPLTVEPRLPFVRRQILEPLVFRLLAVIELRVGRTVNRAQQEQVLVGRELIAPEVHAVVDFYLRVVAVAALLLRQRFVPHPLGQISPRQVVVQIATLG